MLKPSLQLRLSQQLTMTPQLQQAIRLLQLPVLDLTAQIREALAENVMLEAEELPESPVAEPEPMPEVRTATAEESWRDVPSRGQDSGWNGADSRGMGEFADESQESLHEHLLWQLELENLSPRELLIGEAIIDAINDDGYLTVSIDEIREILSPDVEASEHDVEKTLRRIQRFDPSGIGARTLSECIDLQLRQFSGDTPGLGTARLLAAEHLDLMADNARDRLQHELQASEEELGLAIALIRGCHPRPGQAIAPGHAEYVIPDVFVRKVDGSWLVEISSSGVPRLTVNQRYAEMLRGNGGHAALKAQLQEARWLVRSLEIRNETLMKVASCIVERQTEFFEHGEEAMKPMVLRDVAEAVEMHESTISRVTTNKYMHTPRGVLEFRYFFSSHLDTVDGDEQSSVAVRAKIRKLIGAENPRKPLSDNKIAALLKEDGVVVARRTVAKYREAMDIPSSSQRRERSPA